VQKEAQHRVVAAGPTMHPCKTQ